MGIQEPFECRVTDRQLPGSLPSGECARANTLRDSREPLRKLRSFAHPGPADALALLARPLHPSLNKLAVDALHLGVLVPDHSGLRLPCHDMVLSIFKLW